VLQKGCCVVHLSCCAQKNLVTVVIEADAISLSLFSDQCCLQQTAFQKHSFLQSELSEGIIFNPTKLQRLIRAFLQATKTDQSFVAIALQGTVLHEEFISFDPHHEVSVDLAKKIKQSHVWNFNFLPSDHQQHIYLFSMRREILMQYQLLALLTPFQCCLITSTTRGIIELLQSVQFDFSANVSEILHIRSKALDAYVPSSLRLMKNMSEEKETIAFHVGLFLLGKQVLNEVSQ
jgi:hypothetical protein